MKRLATDILLGIEFLLENDSIINIKEGYVSLDGRQYELYKNLSIDNGINKVLCDETRTLSCKTDDQRII